MNIRRKYFKLRPYAQQKKQSWGAMVWQDAVKNVKDHYIYDSPYAKGGFGLVDLQDGDNHYLIPLGSLNNSNIIKPALSSLNTPNPHTAEWPLFYSFGHNIKYTCSCCKDTSITPACAADCAEGSVTCDQCGGEGGYGCEECDGDGNVECYECNGDGMVDCETCGGDGTVSCNECDGNGEVEEDCDICDAEGVIKDSEGKEEDCSNCDGEGFIVEKCDDCEGDGYLDCYDCDNGRIECQYCEGYGSTGCEYCYEGWSDCGDCGGGGTFTCSNCNGHYESSSCGRFPNEELPLERMGDRQRRLIDHNISPRWIEENKIRLESKDKYYKTKLGNKIAVNYFKSRFFNAEFSNGVGFVYSTKAKYFSEILTAEAERLIKKNKSWAKKALALLKGRGRSWAQERVEIPWDYDKLKDEFANHSNFKDYNWDLIRMHIPRKVNINVKGEVVRSIKPSVFPQFKFKETKMQMEYLSNYFTHPAWDVYLKRLNIRVSDLKGSGMINILQRKMYAAGWYYITGEEFYSWDKAKPNINRLIIEYHSSKYSLIGYEEEIFNKKGISKNIGVPTIGARLANKIRKQIGTDYKGTVVMSSIQSGAGVDDGANLTRNKYTSRQIILFESPSSVDVINSMDKLGGHGWTRLYCLGNSTLYRIAGNKLVVHKTGIPGWPKFPMVNVQDVKVISTNLKFHENPFINWKGVSPIDFDDKKS